MQSRDLVAELPLSNELVIGVIGEEAKENNNRLLCVVSWLPICSYIEFAFLSNITFILGCPIFHEHRSFAIKIIVSNVSFIVRQFFSNACPTTSTTFSGLSPFLLSKFLSFSFYVWPSDLGIPLNRTKWRSSTISWATTSTAVHAL